MVAGGRHTFQRESSFCKGEKDKKQRSPTLTRKARAVRFAETVNIHSVPSRRQLTLQEIHSSYMNKSDHFRIRSEIRTSLLRMMQGDLNEKEEEDLRGLEFYTPTASSERSQRIKIAVDFVMRQQKTGEVDEEWLGQVYRKMTASSAAQAHRRGLLDQQKNRSSAPPVQIMVR